jgi:EmrB/QacA subfamily drug resistance transporter
MTPPNHPAAVGSRRGLVLAALCAAALIINIDVTIVNVALPSLVRELGASTSSLQWVIDAYTLVFASLILAAGNLGDRVGRKGVLLAGLAIFGAGSLAGAFAHSAGALIAARAVMGVGAAAIFPATLSLIANVFTERAERAKAIGLWGATTGVGIAAGPIVGGWLLEQYYWGSVFLFMAPIAAVIAGLVAFTVPTSKDPNAASTDWAGLLLSAAGMAILLFGIIEAPDWGWGSAPTLATIAGGIGVLGVFIQVEARTARPMLDVALFRNPRFTAASGSITIGFFTLSGFTFLITQYFQFVHGYSAFAAGVRLLPVAIAVAVASILGTKLAVKIGNKAVVAVGLAAFGVALFWIAQLNPTTAYPVIVGQMLLGGGGLGLVTAPATEAILGAVPKEKAGVGSAVNDATRLFGAALGVAIIGSIAASLYSSRLGASLPQGLPSQAVASAKSSVGGAYLLADHLRHAGLTTAARGLTASATSAFLDSMAGACRAAGAVAIGGAVMAAALLPSRPTAPDVETIETSDHTAESQPAPSHGCELEPSLAEG